VCDSHSGVRYRGTDIAHTDYCTDYGIYIATYSYCKFNSYCVSTVITNRVAKVGGARAAVMVEEI
jgi:hypothetical protein